MNLLNALLGLHPVHMAAQAVIGINYFLASKVGSDLWWQLTDDVEIGASYGQWANLWEDLSGLLHGRFVSKRIE